MEQGNGAARLDESSARKIAAGRLKAIREHTNAGHTIHARNGRPKARIARLHAQLAQDHGEWLLRAVLWRRRGQFTIAQPSSEQEGWVDVVIINYNARRPDNTQAISLFDISAHAVARLLERRRTVEIQRVVAEELADIVADGSLIIRLLNDDPQLTTIATASGEFRVCLDAGLWVATTWIPNPK